MDVQTKEHVIALLHDHQHQIRRFGVKCLGLFGSFALQQQDAESDVDVLVEFEPGRKTFDAFMQLALFPEDLLGRRVELVTPESLSPYIGSSYLERDRTMSTSTRAYLEHILHETWYLIGQSQGLRKEAFLRDDTLKRAFVRSLEIIGEAAKQIPDDLMSAVACGWPSVGKPKKP